MGQEDIGKRDRVPESEDAKRSRVNRFRGYGDARKRKRERRNERERFWRRGHAASRYASGDASAIIPGDAEMLKLQDA